MPLVKQEHQLLPRQDPSCPAGRLFYTCASPQFRGCCSIDACKNRGCPDEGEEGGGSLSRPSTSRARVSPSASRTQSSNERSTRTRGTASGTRPATVTVTESRATGHLHATTTTTPSDAEAAGATVTTTLLGSLPSDTPQSTSESTNKSKSNAGPIAGGVVGVVAVLILLALLYACCWRPRRRRRAGKRDSYGERMPLPSGGREIIEDDEKSRLRASSLISSKFTTHLTFLFFHPIDKFSNWNLRYMC